MMLVLIICLAVSFGSSLPSLPPSALTSIEWYETGIQSWIEGGVIAGVIFINVAVGFLQEYSSAKTMDSLRSLASPSAQVIRNGKSVAVPSPQVVVGDIVELKTGELARFLSLF